MSLGFFERSQAQPDIPVDSGWYPAEDGSQVRPLPIEPREQGRSMETKSLRGMARFAARNIIAPWVIVAGAMPVAANTGWQALSGDAWDEIPVFTANPLSWVDAPVTQTFESAKDIIKVGKAILP